MDVHAEERRFKMTYWFVVGFGAINIALIIAIVFCHIPKDNQQSANMALAFCMSAFTGLSGYLIGASPEKKKDTVPGAIQSNVIVNEVDASKTDQP